MYDDEYYDYDNSDELEHYGVKGMKWGVRKENYSSRHTQRLGRKADKANARYERTGNAKYQAKSERYNVRREASQKVDDARKKYIMETGGNGIKRGLKTYGKYSLMGVGTYSYNTARALGRSRIESCLNGILTYNTAYPYWLNRGEENKALRERGLKK